MDRVETGRRGEGAAARLYSQRGCTVLARNYHTRYGELDLILRDQQEGLIFCEVKTRAAGTPYAPAEAVDAAKRRRLILAAELYLQRTGQSDEPVRFDIAEVTPLDSGRWMVHIIKGAFSADDIAP